MTYMLLIPIKSIFAQIILPFSSDESLGASSDEVIFNGQQKPISFLM